ncbi:MAG: sugar nucleotide-binding protein [bacterium]
MKKIVVTGASGLVGSRIVELLSGKFDFYPLSLKEMDITDKDSVHNTLSSLSYDLILHLAGYTFVDGAEKEQNKAYLINETGTKNLIDVSSSAKKQFIYISTDFVFDGINPPYTEVSVPNPISVYGASKLAGEKAVGTNGMIVRISYPYRATFDLKKDIVRSLKNILEAGKPLSMVEDSLMVPTFIDDIAEGLGFLMNNYSCEVHHLVGGDAMSPFALAKTIAHAFHFDENLVEKITYEKYFENKAKAPQYSDIQSKKNTFYPMHTFEEGLSIIKKQLRDRSLTI